MALGNCIDCGKMLPPGQKKRGLCFDCGIKHMQESARQLREKKGPYYEKWKAGMKAAAERL